MDKSLCGCREEVEILLRYGKHPGIVTLKTVYEDTNKIYLVLQLLKGGDLLDYMNAKVFNNISIWKKCKKNNELLLVCRKHYRNSNQLPS